MTGIKYLIDNNLPYYFGFWNTPEYIHQFDIGDDWKDSQIWEFARMHSLTIITKDSDFSNRVLFHNPPPKVIHIRFGNIRMSEFHDIIANVWEEVIEMNEKFKLVNVFSDRIEGIH